MSPVPVEKPIEEEAELAAIRLGDHHALEKMEKANIRFVVSVCRNYWNPGLLFIPIIK